MFLEPAAQAVGTPSFRRTVFEGGKERPLEPDFDKVGLITALLSLALPFGSDLVRAHSCQQLVHHHGEDLGQPLGAVSPPSSEISSGSPLALRGVHCSSHSL